MYVCMHVICTLVYVMHMHISNNRCHRKTSISQNQINTKHLLSANKISQVISQEYNNTPIIRNYLFFLFLCMTIAKVTLIACQISITRIIGKIVLSPVFIWKSIIIQDKQYPGDSSHFVIFIGQADVQSSADKHQDIGHNRYLTWCNQFFRSNIQTLHVSRKIKIFDVRIFASNKFQLFHKKIIRYVFE